MELALGFVIALMITLTGVGAGSMTTPLLILLLGVAPPTAVGTALAFGAIVKVFATPGYIFRRQVNLRVLGFLLAGGLPGVLIGSYCLGRLKDSSYSGFLYAMLGGIIVSVSLFNLYRMFSRRAEKANQERPRLLWASALFIGSEVGFSSAGAGALGSLVLISFTKLTTAEIVGTDLCFGLALSGVGSFIQISRGNYDPHLLGTLVVGGICGAIAGSLLAGRIAQRPMRVALLSALVVLGTQLALHGGNKPQPQERSQLQAMRR